MLLLAGCASTKTFEARKRQPAQPGQVDIYQDKPWKYEHIATITLDMKPWFDWDAHGNANKGFEELKRQARELGANGVLLRGLPGQTNGRVAAGYHDEFLYVPVITKPFTAVAQAIRVSRR